MPDFLALYQNNNPESITFIYDIYTMWGHVVGLGINTFHKNLSGMRQVSNEGLNGVEKRRGP